MVRIGDPVKFPGITGTGYGGFDLFARAILIVVAADEEFRLRTGVQKIVAVGAAFRGHGKAQRDESRDAGIAAGRAETNVSSEGESGEEDRQVVFAVEPIERCADIVLFAVAFVVRAFAEAGASEVESQHGQAEGLEGLHRVVDDFVVERASAERMGMTDEGGIRSIRAAGIQQRLKAACGRAQVVDAAHKCGTGGCVRHLVPLYGLRSGILVFL